MLPSEAGWTVAEVAVQLGGRVHGDGGTVVRDLRPLDLAGPADLSFLHRRRYKARARASYAAAIIVSEPGGLEGRTLIVVPDASAAYRAAIDLFYPAGPRVAGISREAIIDEAVVVGRNVHVGPGAIVGAHTQLGDGASIMAGAIIGDRCRIGRDTTVYPGAVLYPDAVLGDRVIVHANAVIGRDGFGFHRLPHGELVRVRQVGRVIVEDDVEIGPCTCVDRAALAETRVGAGTKIDGLVLVAHNVQIGEHCLIIGHSGIAGSTQLGARSNLYGGVAVSGHLTLAESTTVLIRSCVLDDTAAGQTVAGYPAMPARLWRRVVALTKRLPDLLHRPRGTPPRSAPVAINDAAESGADLGRRGNE